jgi:hypothetical protein
VYEHIKRVDVSIVVLLHQKHLYPVKSEVNQVTPN